MSTPGRQDSHVSARAGSTNNRQVVMFEPEGPRSASIASRSSFTVRPSEYGSSVNGHQSKSGKQATASITPSRHSEKPVPHPRSSANTMFSESPTQHHDPSQAASVARSTGPRGAGQSFVQSPRASGPGSTHVSSLFPQSGLGKLDHMPFSGSYSYTKETVKQTISKQTFTNGIPGDINSRVRKDSRETLNGQPVSGRRHSHRLVSVPEAVFPPDNWLATGNPAFMNTQLKLARAPSNAPGSSKLTSKPSGTASDVGSAHTQVSQGSNVSAATLNWLDKLPSQSGVDHKPSNQAFSTSSLNGTSKTPSGVATQLSRSTTKPLPYRAPSTAAGSQNGDLQSDLSINTHQSSHRGRT